MSDITKELKQIAAKHGGVLKPEDVVAFAVNPKTALHSRFTWDDTKAAAEYRLWQARQVIRVNVEILDGVKEPVKVFVSLKSDRYGGSGYRPLVNVMSNDDQRAELLQQAKDEADAWRVKYRRLAELVPVFEAMDRVFVRSQQPKPKGKRKLQPA